MKQIIIVPAILIAALFSSGRSFAQAAVVHDPQKELQIGAMENGKWKFKPDWYYYLFHRKYSGAEAYWQWAGFKSGLRIRFKEEKSTIKRTMPVRILSEETQNQKFKQVVKEEGYIKELYKEDLAKELDRTVDAAYLAYKDEFNRMQDLITENLLICESRSKGKMKTEINELVRQNAIICEKVSYVRKTGPGYQLENVKRQKAYEEAKTAMSGIVKKSTSLAALAVYLYK